LGSVLTVGSEVEQALLNVYNNAVAAMPNGGEFVLSARRLAPNGAHEERVRIRVSDSGSGMSQSVLERATEPFFTTKGAGEGTGLGLAMVQAHVQQCKGRLELSSTEGRGTTVAFDYPAFEGTREIESEGGEEYTVGGSETILVVEDEAVVRRVTRSMLVAAGYEVITATHGEEALELVKRRAEGARADLLNTDAVMPRMGGRALYETLVGEGKSLPVIVCSGYARGTLDSEFFEFPERVFLQKPFTRAQLLTAVRNLLDHSSV
jgi:CheY-like chemotaxis protein/anti-sigma regulatory factor (Ser/Thr protein kinase)